MTLDIWGMLKEMWEADVNLSNILTGPTLTVSAISGGVVLGSGEVRSILVKALPNNSGDIYQGGVTNRPYSGCGFIISPGEAKASDLNNLNRVYLCAQISGDQVCYEGLAV